MIKLNTNKLNELEKTIHETLSNELKENKNLTILEASELVGVSPSKISKFSKKIGFDNFKQYKSFFNGDEINYKPVSDELERIKNYIETFDPKLVDDFIDIFNKYDKIILFGYGPSYICADYFAYRLRTITQKFIISSSEEVEAINLADENTLLIVFSTTGKFRNFDNFFSEINKKGGNILLILEEYNSDIDIQNNTTYFLTKTHQDKNLLPYEKSRTIFFIFMEEILKKLSNNKKN